MQVRAVISEPLHSPLAFERINWNVILPTMVVFELESKDHFSTSVVW